MIYIGGGGFLNTSFFFHENYLRDICNQIKNRTKNISNIPDGFFRFCIGLSKKVLIANQLGYFADYIFSIHDVASISAPLLWLGAIAFALQIYYDFSGYSDMAIGLGLMFGFKIKENFKDPYLAKGATDFWRRWHISLSSWFRDYLYFPLGGSRVEKKSRLVFNLFMVWLMTGIWHGANWTFIVWGLMYFVLLVIEKQTGLHKSEKFKPLRYIYTIFFVIIGWVIFRASSIENAVEYIGAMFGFSGISADNSALFYLKENVFGFVLALLASTPVFRKLYEKYLSESKGGQVFVAVSLIIIFLLSVIYIVKGTYNPFIYFNF